METVGGREKTGRQERECAVSSHFSLKRVVIIEDEALLSSMLGRLIEERPFLELAGTASDGIKGVELFEEVRPDIVILDINLPGMHGLEVLRQIKRADKEVYVLVITGMPTGSNIRLAVREGADGFLEKNSEVDELEKTLDHANAGMPYYSALAMKAIREFLEQPDAPNPLDILTQREQQVLKLIAESHSTKEISVKLKLGIGTVNTHRWNLMRKLDLHDTAGLTRFAIRHGLVLASQ